MGNSASEVEGKNERYMGRTREKVEPYVFDPERPSPLVEVPVEVLVEILRFLPLKERVRCAMVCWTLYDAVYNPELWLPNQQLIIKDKDTDEVLEVYQQMINSFEDGCNQLQDIRMRRCRKLTGPRIIELLENCPNVVHLDVSGTPITDAHLGVIAANMKQLRVLDISGCKKLNGTTLKDICGDHLREIRVAYVTMTAGFLSKLADCEFLEILDLSHTGGVSTGHGYGHGAHSEFATGLDFLLATTIRLHTLNLSNCKFGNYMETWTSLANNKKWECPSLTDLDLTGIGSSQQFLEAIPRRFPNLTKLSLEKMSSYNVSKELMASALGPLAAQMTSLNLRGLDGGVHEYYAQAHWKTAELILELGPWHALEHLDLGFLSTLTDDDLLEVCEQIPTLRSLKFDNCPNVRRPKTLEKLHVILPHMDMLQDCHHSIPLEYEVLMKFWEDSQARKAT